MQKRDKQKWLGVLLVLLLVLGSTTTFFQQLTHFPVELRLMKGQLKQFRLDMPVSATANLSNPDVIRVNGLSKPMVAIDLSRPFTVSTQTIGHTLLTLKLFDTVPIKQVKVRVLPDIRVIPGGQSIGVKLKSSGVLVVGYHLIKNNKINGSPAEKADIRIGDYLTKINGKPIVHVEEVGKAVQEAGKSQKPLMIHLVRRGEEKQVQLSPIFDEKDQAYRLGLYIRDSAAGVGTLTFYDPNKKVYGALGHVITDMDTGQAIRVGDGKILYSNVTSIQKGESGEPGEKRAIFFHEDHVLGNITKNTSFGIFGKMASVPGNGLYSQPVPIALAEQVKEGPAKILTVVEGQKVEAFDIMISHVMKQKFPATKGIIIKITDPRLLEKTGGIVQGMSGSPIIQDGKLVGAVTHVFVNDPTAGYGTFIEWMLQDAGVIQQTADLTKDPLFYGKKCNKEGTHKFMSKG
ncbi:SpoIVB peptidase [Thermoflavimicrobium dichotomicum]|uniref:Stage IV sporulation protein B n=1 Tax=Thermoflavimicrobium dichotomicum TaxID=46223 RepID=A0A1I3QBE9_9BACL|nr:SpoIVB peptidase [Thermoflavimicrobium dichotomicum]SFJ30641.1 stage IV sporulation protein B [Thermoflavimicrobium dichotomicum]